MEYEILVTENHSYNPERFSHNVVRVFVDHDFDYGYWVPEDKLYECFNDEQKKQYLADQSYTGGRFKVSKEIAQHIIDIGHTPFNKIKLQ